MNINFGLFYNTTTIAMFTPYSVITPVDIMYSIDTKYCDGRVKISNSDIRIIY